MAEMPRFDRVMSDAEGLMWRLEKDPYLSSTFGTVAILDRAPDFDALRRRMERAVVEVPRLGQRVQMEPVSMAAVAPRRTRPSIATSAKIVLSGDAARTAFADRPLGCRDIGQQPMRERA